MRKLSRIKLHPRNNDDHNQSNGKALQGHEDPSPWLKNIYRVHALPGNSAGSQAPI